MKTISKIAVVASACALAAALSACGSSSPAPSATPEGSGAAAPAAAEASAPVEAAPADTSAAVEPAAGVALEDAKSYVNDNFGIAFDLPEGWAFVDTSAEQAQLDEVGAGVSVEARAAGPDGISSYVIMYEPLSETNANQDEATHAGGLFGESLAGAEVTEASITLGDREIPASFASMETEAGSVAALAAAMKNDQGFLDILITAPTQDEVAEIAKKIAAL